MGVLLLSLALAMEPAVPPPRWQPPVREVSNDDAVEAKALGLRRKGSGYERIREDGDRFDAFIRPDGSVEFKVDPEVVVQLDGVCAFALCVGGRKTATPTRRRS